MLRLAPLEKLSPETPINASRKNCPCQKKPKKKKKKLLVAPVRRMAWRAPGQERQPTANGAAPLCGSAASGLRGRISWRRPLLQAPRRAGGG